MTSHLRYDFPVISDGPTHQESGKTWKEKMLDAEGMDGGKPGEPFGMVTLTNETTPDGKPAKKFEAEFSFGDGDTATYGGKIPGDGSWKGKEKLKLQKKGRRPRRDEIELVSTNPKRWG
jgi:hypothetical protein